MSLLREIQEAACGDDVPLSSVLRRCKVLASRLHNSNFSAWVAHELDGYPSLDSLPAYRRLPQEAAFGDFANIAWRATGMQISRLSVPEDKRDTLFTIYLMDGVAEYETLLASGESQFRNYWPPEAVMLYGDRFYERMHCTSAWKALTRGAVAGVLDTVRNKALDFALEIERDLPDAGEAPPGDAPISQDKVNQIFNTVVMGASNVSVAGSASVVEQMGVLNQNPGLDELAAFLTTLGLSGADVDALRGALDDDAAHGAGTKTRMWLGDIALRAASGTLKLAGSAGTEVLARVVNTYLQAHGL